MPKRTMAASFLVGPTASGKSSVAQWIAEQDSSEILSADSMLVYRGMDIGTAKPSIEDRTRVRHHGIDLVAPGESFSVWAYARYASNALREIDERGNRAIVVGGTGLYIKSLTDGLDVSASPDYAARERWTRALEEQGIEALQNMLRSLDPSAYEALKDKSNARRLVRALENANTGERQPGSWSGQADNGSKIVGLSVEPATLSARIVERVQAMYRSGLLDEVRSLMAAGPLSRTAAQAIGYAEAIDLIAGRCTQDEAVRRTTVRTRQLAKRQRTWFKHQANVAWVDVREGMSVEDVGETVRRLWREHGRTRIGFRPERESERD